MEMLALTLADLTIRKLKLDAVIFSDCTSALRTMRDHDKLRYSPKKQNLLLLQQSRWLTSTMRHVRSHPEKYANDKRAWTRHMWGNHLADRACMQDRTDHSHLADNKYFTMTVNNALKSLTQENVLYWANKD